MEPTKQKNVCALLTPSGRGAVAVVWLSGPDSVSLIDQRFRPAARKSYSSLNRDIVYGVWEPSGEDLVVCRRNESEFEIHCHGGSLASSQVLDSLTTANVKLVSETQVAYAKGMHSWELGVRSSLAQATTKRTTEILLKQLTLLPKAIDELVESIQAGSESANDPVEQVEAILQFASFGIHLSEPQIVVFCGQPNVGKSSLLNAIAGFQRAIVHDQPGTTRDVVSQQTAIDGWPVLIKDTAGLRETSAEIESLGIEKAKQQIAAADIVVAVFDLSRPWTNEDELMRTEIAPDIVIHNKSDLVEPLEAADSTRPEGLMVSAINGTNMQLLVESLGKQLVPSTPDSTTAFPVTQAQLERLNEVRARLKDHDPIQAVQLLLEFI